MANLEVPLDIGEEGKSIEKDTKGQAEGVFKNVLEGLGIGSGMALITGIVKTFQPLVSVISTILKELTLLLSPIGNVLIGLLYPILLILKPFALAINQVMLPFLLQAMDFFREGATEGDATKTAAGFATLLTGLQSVMIYISAELVKMTSVIMLSALASIVGIFSEDAASYITDSLIPSIGSMVDLVAATQITQLALNVIALGESLGTEMGGFITDVTGMIDTVFTSLSDEFINDITEALLLTQTDGLNAGFASLSEAASTEWGNITSDAVFDIGNAFQSMIGALGVDIPEIQGDTNSGVLGRLYSFFSSSPVVGAAISTVSPIAGYAYSTTRSY